MFISSHALRDSCFSARCCCAALLLCFRHCGNFSMWSCTMQSRRCRGGGTCVVPRDGRRLPRHLKYRRGRAPTVSFQTHACPPSSSFLPIGHTFSGLGKSWKIATLSSCYQREEMVSRSDTRHAQPEEEEVGGARLECQNVPPGRIV